MKNSTFISLSLLGCLLQVTLSSQDATTPTSCGYSSCPPTRADRINVHIVAHTHDDVGWLKTVDQYYYGTKKRYSNVGVQFILDSVIPQLILDKSKRFIYVEMAFFTKWWREQDDSMRDIVRSLVQQGRLEFINGGWCMNDEATVSYHSTIEQMTLGLRFLNQTFGPCGLPRVGWQIDPFGHTNEQASLFAQFGFDGMFFTREGWEDKRARVQNKSLDFMWHGDKILDNGLGSIFTSIFRDGYDAPEGYCFDTLCLDDNLVDNEESYEYNIEAKGESYIKFLRKYASSRAFNHILIPMGGDFQYSAASHNFKNLDKLIKYVKLNAPDLNIFYSTPSCYQYALYQNLSQGSDPRKLPEKFDDFLPYDSTFTIWWSGFFSSRPSGKLVERQVANLLPVTRLVSLHELLVAKDDDSWTKTSLEHESACLNPLWEILGDLQHHDAITGTEKQHVNDDYVRRSTVAMDKCAKFMGQIVRKEMVQSFNNINHYSQAISQQKPIFLEKTSFCTLLNISQCGPIESKLDESLYNMVTTLPIISNDGVDEKEVNHSDTRAVLLNIYNPLARHIQDYDIRLPCNGICDINRVQVNQLSYNSTLKLVRLPLPSGISTLPFRDATTTFEFLFYIDLPPLSRTTLLIEDQNNDEQVDGVLLSSREFSDDSPPMPVKLYDEETIISHPEKQSKSRLRRSVPRMRYAEITVKTESDTSKIRKRRELDDSFNNFSTGSGGRIIIKFDMHKGTLVGLRRVRDPTFTNITQKFGYYFPSSGKSPGAYIFRPNSTDPTFIDKPESFKMFRKKDGSLIEIHQKWADWIWQTIRVDAKKNYIEFDYVVGPVPVLYSGDGAVVEGREVITRYMTSVKSDGIFMTDSNSRQLVPRHRINSTIAENLGGSFYPVVSSMVLKDMKVDNSSLVDTIAILVDRPQAGSSLNDGELEFLIHRRHMKDDEWGVSEALNEPGEDGRGLVTRGKHRLYIKFADTPSYRSNLIELSDTKESNLNYEKYFRVDRLTNTENSKLMPTYFAQDAVLDELRIEGIKLSMKPVLTFDRLQVCNNGCLDMMKSLRNDSRRFSVSLLNNSLPTNIHLLTLQARPENQRQLLIRLENLDNPLTVHPFPQPQAYKSLVSAYKASSGGIITVPSKSCNNPLRHPVGVDIEYLIKNIRIVSLEELRLGANVQLASNKRLNWPGLDNVSAIDECLPINSGSYIKLAPRQIRTYLATFEYI